MTGTTPSHVGLSSLYSNCLIDSTASSNTMIDFPLAVVKPVLTTELVKPVLLIAVLVTELVKPVLLVLGTQLIADFPINDFSLTRLAIGLVFVTAVSI